VLAVFDKRLRAWTSNLQKTLGFMLTAVFTTSRAVRIHQSLISFRLLAKSFLGAVFKGQSSFPPSVQSNSCICPRALAIKTLNPSFLNFSHRGFAAKTRPSTEVPVS